MEYYHIINYKAYCIIHMLYELATKGSTRVTSSYNKLCTCRYTLPVMTLAARFRVLSWPLAEHTETCIHSICFDVTKGYIVLAEDGPS